MTPTHTSGRLSTVLLLLLVASLFVICHQQEQQQTTGRGTSVKVHYKPHTFAPTEDYLRRQEFERLSVRSWSTARAGSSIPMSGGLLTLGAYFAELAVGTPPQNFKLIIDTGSSNTAIPSTDCDSTCPKLSKKYSPTASSSYKAVPCNSNICGKCNTDQSATQCLFGNPFCSAVRPDSCGFGITYGGGSSALYGAYAQETLCLGEFCAESTLGMISTEVTFGDTGILGMASDFNACNPSCVPTIVDDLVAANQLQDQFGMCINPSQGGIIDFGSFNSSHYKGDLTWVPMSMDRWYNMDFLDMKVGGISLGLPSFVYWTTNDVIGSFVDSGTSIVLTGPSIFSALTETFQNNFCSLPGVCGKTSLFAGDCLTASELAPHISSFPNITITVNDVFSTPTELTISPEAYLMPVGNQFCLGIASTPSLGVILGDVFLQDYYVAYDRVNSILGFAPSQNCY